MQNGFNTVRALYSNPDDVDLYVGILMEQPMNGAIVGPTAGCIIADQFIALRLDIYLDSEFLRKRTKL